MQYRPLGTTGMTVSCLSFGGSSLGGVFREISEVDGIRTVHTALDHGINFIDTSPYYGVTQAETVLGKALKEVDRSRYFLATKVGQYADGLFDFSATRVIRSVDESLARLHVDYIDLIQCHDIEFADIRQIVEETLPALHRLKVTGKVRHVGITGLPLKVLTQTVERAPQGSIETVLSFCRYTLGDTAFEGAIPFFEQHQVGIINASPTGMGLLTPNGPPAWHPGTPQMKAVALNAIAACRAKGIDIVELAIQFSVAHPRVATTLVGTADPREMLANIRSASTPVDPDKLRFALAALAPIHNHNFTRGRPENTDPLIS